MSSLGTFLVAVALLWSCLWMWVAGEGGAVVSLTEHTFNEFVMDPTRHVLVEFFAAWCSHCVEFADTYEQVAHDLRDEPTVKVAKVDGAVWGSLVQRYGIRAYPSFVVFSKTDKSGTRVFQGKRGRFALADFVLAGGRAPGEEVEDSAVVGLTQSTFMEAVMDPSKDVLVNIYPGWCASCGVLAVVFEELAREVR
eukprot:RCo053837